MNLLRYILIIFLSSLTISGYSQRLIQYGYVKTKGQIGANGTVISGTRLAGVTISIKGGKSVVSDAKGEFYLPLHEQTFFLQNVQKQGYVLLDPDVLSKQYAYSKKPLVLVLETPSQQAVDKLAAERKIRRTLQQHLQAKQDEIELLKEQKKLNEEEYRKQLQELYSQQENNEKLIVDMAGRYSKLDFDEVDEFNRRISQFILEGNLSGADSLLNTKGDINSRMASLRQQINNIEQDIKTKQENLEKIRLITRKQLEDLAQDCYRKFDIFQMQHQNDSAAYYIKLRADIDSTNIQRNVDAGKYIQVFLADNNNALAYYLRALYNATTQYGENHPVVATCCHNIGTVYEANGDYGNARDYFIKALSIRKDAFAANPSDLNKIDLANSFNNIGGIYYNQGIYDKALDYYKGALFIEDNYIEEQTPEKAKLYKDIGSVYNAVSKFDLALEYYSKSLQSFISIYGDEHPYIATCYNEMGVTYENMGKDSLALESHIKALQIRKKHLGNNHPDMCSSYINIGSLYDNTLKYDEALECYQKALQILKLQYGEKHIDIAKALNNIGITYYNMNDMSKALQYLEQSVEMMQLFLPETHPDIISIIDNIDYIKRKIKASN